MRLLANLPDAEQAEKFADYLTGSGIPNSREESANGGGWAIWIEREDQLDQARGELEQFQRSPGAEKYQKAGRSARAFESAQEQLTRRLARNFINYRLQGSQAEATDQQTFPATLVLIGVCVIVAMISQLGNDLGRIDGFFFQSLARPFDHSAGFDSLRYFGPRVWPKLIWHDMSDIRAGQVWRLITPIFIHFGALHLIFNMWWLWELGKMIERRKGTIFFSVLVVVSAVISNTGEFAWAGPFFGGMSGVVYALFGYAWIKGLCQPNDRVGVNNETVWIMLGWLAICMIGIGGKWLGDVANTAHILGLLVGAAFGVVPWLWFRARRQMRLRAFQ